MCLKPNELYPEMFMEENMIYPKSIFDRLSVNFHAEFSGTSDTGSDITADYAVQVKVRGFQIKGEEKKTVYEKTFPLSVQSGLKFSKAAYISEEISVDFSQYENYINNVEAIINADPSSEAQLIFTGNFKAETEFGNKEELFTYSIPLPLFENLFTIDKPAAVETTGSITKTEVTEISSEKSLLIIPGAVIFIMLLFIIYIALWGVLPTEEESRALRFKSIMRKHGSRIVRVTRSIGQTCETELIIKDIEGMVKISDEYNIPIFYIPDENGMPEENSMFIPGRGICYIYHINQGVTRTTT